MYKQTFICMSRSLRMPLSLLLSLSLSLSLFLFLSLSLSLFLSLFVSLFLSLFPSLSRSLGSFGSITLSLSLSHSHFLAFSHFRGFILSCTSAYCLSLSLSHTHTRTQTHSPPPETHILSNTLTHIELNAQRKRGGREMEGRSLEHHAQKAVCPKCGERNPCKMLALLL